MAQSIETLRLKKELDGDVYIISEKKEVASSTSTNLHLENPSGSGKKYLVYRATYNTEAESSSHIVDDFDSISAGTSVDVHSSRASVRNNTPLNAYQDSTYTGIGQHSYSVIGGGGGGESQQGGESSTPSLVLEEGSDAVLSITNESSSSADVIGTWVVIEINT